MQRHRHQEFLRFLNRLERDIPAVKPVHVILDNCGSHKHPKVRAWLTRVRAGPATSPRLPRPGSTRSKVSFARVAFWVAPIWSSSSTCRRTGRHSRTFRPSVKFAQLPQDRPTRGFFHLNDPLPGKRQDEHRPRENCNELQTAVMTKRYLEDFAVGQTFGSERVRVDKERTKRIRSRIRSSALPPRRGAARDPVFRGLGVCA
jgi:hypothetical protein